MDGSYAFPLALNEVTSIQGSAGLLVLRLLVSFLMFVVHGAPKLNSFKKELQHIDDPFHMGKRNVLVVTILVEILGSVLVALGAFTRLACVPLAGTMCVALFVVHRKRSLEHNQFIILFLAAYLALMLTGPGVFSVDHILERLLGLRPAAGG